MAFDSRRRAHSPSSRSPAPSSGSLSSRFSSIAAQRISAPARNSPAASTANTRRPGREVHGAVQKAGGQRHRAHHRNDRRMEIDTIGNDSDRRASNNHRNRPSNNNRSNRTPRNGDRKNDRSRSARPDRREEKKSLNQSDLDKDLEAYMMKSTTTAQATLDMEIDSYMASAPSKN